MAAGQRPPCVFCPTPAYPTLSQWLICSQFLLAVTISSFSLARNVFSSALDEQKYSFPCRMKKTVGSMSFNFPSSRPSVQNAPYCWTYLEGLCRNIALLVAELKWYLAP